MLCRVYVPHVPVTRALAIPALRLAHTAALRHSLRPAPVPSHAQQPSPAREALRTRSFSSTAHRRAQEDPGLKQLFEQQQKVTKLLHDKPEILEDMRKFVETLKENGVDVQSGQMPSKMDMVRLMMKTEVRESAMKMVAAFQEAGLDLRSKDMMQSLMEMQNELKGK